MLIDTHAHLNFSAFDKDRNILTKKCLKEDIWMINIGTNYETSKKAIEIAKKYEKGVYASIGLHPINLDTGLIKIKNAKCKKQSPEDVLEKDFDYQEYKKLAYSTSSGQACSKVVAIGEIGLDYYWKPKTTRKKELFKQKQRTGLCQQLNKKCQ